MTCRRGPFEAYISAATSVRHLLKSRTREQCRIALLLTFCVTTWSLTWAQALGLLSLLPIWATAAAFFAGLGLIPVCRSARAQDRAASRQVPGSVCGQVQEPQNDTVIARAGAPSMREPAPSRRAA
jgi:hypothetical protein